MASPMVLDCFVPSERQFVHEEILRYTFAMMFLYIQLVSINYNRLKLQQLQLVCMHIAHMDCST